MNAVWGAGLATVAVLLFAWVYGETRRPSPPAWARGEFLPQMLALALTGAGLLGVTQLALFAADFSVQIADWRAQVAFVTGAALLWTLVPGLIAPAMGPRRKPEPGPDVDLMTGRLPRDPRPDRPTRGAGARPGIRKAA